MKNEEAKFILTAYRPGGRDAGDEKFAAALAQAKADPALGAWFARSQTHDTAVAAKLTAIVPPAGLREAILAGARASANAPARRWSAPWMLAAAAAIVVGISLALWQSNRNETPVDRLADLALADMQHGRHGGHGGPTAALQQWLDSADAKLASATLPADFDQLSQTGCRTLSVGGREALEVCFARGGAEFHVYILRRDQMPGLPDQHSPALVARASGSAAVWSDARYSYAVVSPAGPDAIRRLL